MGRLYVALLLTLAPGALAEDWKALDGTPQRMLSDYLRGMARRQLETRKSEVNAIQTTAAYDARKARLREAALRMIGGLPAERSPLNARVTGVLQRGDYRVEKVVYESLPRFYVTANLYIPKGSGPFPAVLQPVGHSTTAKNRAFYQKIAIALVKTGFVVLTYDPIGQGERRIFYDADLGDSKAGGTTAEHSMIGWQSLLGGESVARYRIWDGMRSVDYLLSRPEVDRTRLGVTGCSGGGTLTTYLAALDDRLRVAAPACYISDWEDQLNGTGPQDAEQQFPDQLLAGLNHADWIGLAAPKPYLIVSTDQDFFPLAGASKAFQEMKRIYTLYDAAVKVEWFHEPGPHGLPDASRVAICRWMKQWLGSSAEPYSGPIVTEHEEDLNVTATGQVSTSLGGETASTWNIRRFRERKPARLGLQALREEIVRLTRYQRTSGKTEVQGVATREVDGVRVELLRYRSDAGLLIPVALCGAGNRVALYLDTRGKANALRPGSDVWALVKAGYRVWVPDLSGIGETEFQRHDQLTWSSAHVTWLALMAGRPLLGIRMNDLLRGLDALEEYGIRPTETAAFATGRMGPVLLHAAVLDERIQRVTIEQSLLSYGAIARHALHKDVHDSIVPGVLGRYDLPQLAAALAPRPVRIVNALAPNGQLLLRAEAQAEFPAAKVLLRREGEALLDALRP